MNPPHTLMTKQLLEFRCRVSFIKVCLVFPSRGSARTKHRKCLYTKISWFVTQCKRQKCKAKVRGNEDMQLSLLDEEVAGISEESLLRGGGVEMETDVTDAPDDSGSLCHFYSPINVSCSIPQSQRYISLNLICNFLWLTYHEGIDSSLQNIFRGLVYILYLFSENISMHESGCVRVRAHVFSKEYQTVCLFVLRMAFIGWNRLEIIFYLSYIITLLVLSFYHWEEWTF